LPDQVPVLQAHPQARVPARDQVLPVLDQVHRDRVLVLPGRDQVLVLRAPAPVAVPVVMAATRRLPEEAQDLDRLVLVRQDLDRLALVPEAADPVVLSPARLDLPCS
jgi:hypothetical protein